MPQPKDKAPPKPKHDGPYPHQIDYKTLDKLCAIQCTGEECAAILGIDYDTLNRRLKEDGEGGFTDYYAQKAAGGKVSLRRKQYQKAVDEGNPAMLIWLGKQWLGQKEPERLEQVPNTVPINISIVNPHADSAN